MDYSSPIEIKPVESETDLKPSQFHIKIIDCFTYKDVSASKTLPNDAIN